MNKRVETEKKNINDKYVKNFTCAVIDKTWSFIKIIIIKISNEVQLKEKDVRESKEIKRKSTEKIDTKEFIKEESKRKDSVWKKSTRKKFIWKKSTQKESCDIRRKSREKDKIFERKLLNIEVLFGPILVESKFRIF